MRGEEKEEEGKEEEEEKKGDGGGGEVSAMRINMFLCLYPANLS